MDCRVKPGNDSGGAVRPTHGKGCAMNVATSIGKVDYDGLIPNNVG